jgi:hypothetical protein
MSPAIEALVTPDAQAALAAQLAVHDHAGPAQGVAKLAELPKQQQVNQAVVSIVPIRDLKVTIPQAVVGKDKKTGQQAAEIEISTDPNAWPFKVDGADHLASFEVAGFAYDLNNKLVDSFSENYTLRIQTG